MNNQIISQTYSNKIKVLSVIAIIMVLFIHVQMKEGASMPVVEYVQRVFGFCGLSFIANPFFFVVSGFFFFRGVSLVSDCYPKIMKRVRTLFVPYVLWNVLFVSFFVVCYYVPALSRYVGTQMVENIFGSGVVNALFEIFVRPANFPLWFLRDLMIYVALSPLFFWTLTKYKKGTLIVFFIFGTLGLLFLPPVIKLWGTFFFVLGGYIALHSSLNNVSDGISVRMAVICGVVYVFNAFFRPLAIVPLNGTDMFVELCGLIALWRLSDFVIKDYNRCPLLRVSPFVFFVFVFHEPSLTILNKVGILLLGLHEWSLILLGIINPFIMLLLSVLVARVIKVLCPTAYSLIVGGRGVKSSVCTSFSS